MDKLQIIKVYKTGDKDPFLAMVVDKFFVDEKYGILRLQNEHVILYLYDNDWSYYETFDYQEL
jgi:hypothetical protein